MEWRPVPGYPAYEISREGWVRNVRMYPIAQGKGALLSCEGKAKYHSRAQLLELAAQAFGVQGPPAPPARPAQMPSTPLAPTTPAEPSPVVAAEKQPESEREYDRINPLRVIPLRDPWAEGLLETESEWDFAGIM